MAEFRVLIGGTERTVALPSLTLQRVVNGPDILTCEVLDEDGVYQPGIDDLLALERTDVSPASFWEGVIQVTEERALTGHGVGRVTRVTAYDYSVYPSFVTATISFGSATSPVATLESALQDLVTEYLTAYGITLHPSQVTGPTLDALAYDGATVDSILNDLSQQTGFVWKVDADLQLEMWDPSTRSAGFDLTGTPNTYVGDVTVERFRQRYYNRVIVYGGEGYNQNISGELKIGDGSATKFLLDAPMYYFGPVVLEVTRSGVAGIELVDGVEWIFDGDDYSINNGTAATLGNGDTMLVGVTGYSAWYPMKIVADGRGSPPDPPRDLIIRRPDLFNRAAMQTLADQALAVSQSDFIRATYETEELDIAPGESQTCTLTERNLSGAFICTEARLFNVTDGDTSTFRQQLTVVNGVNAKAIWMDLYRRWLGSTAGSAPVASSPTTTAVISATATAGIVPLPLEVRVAKLDYTNAQILAGATSPRIILQAPAANELYLPIRLLVIQDFANPTGYNNARGWGVHYAGFSASLFTTASSTTTAGFSLVNNTAWPTGLGITAENQILAAAMECHLNADPGGAGDAANTATVYLIYGRIVR